MAYVLYHSFTNDTSCVIPSQPSNHAGFLLRLTVSKACSRVLEDGLHWVQVPENRIFVSRWDEDFKIRLWRSRRDAAGLLSTEMKGRVLQELLVGVLRRVGCSPS